MARGMNMSTFILLIILAGYVRNLCEAKVAIDCETTSKDLIFSGDMAIVACPSHCEAAVVYGTTIHPSSSSVCAAGIADGVLPTMGGELVVTKVPGLASYSSKDTGVVQTLTAVDEKMGAFHVYALDTVEKINADVRVVDASGGLSNVGLLQVRTGAGFGSVCGMNPAAADVVCNILGYARGSVGSSRCSFYGGADLCAAPGTPVAMAELTCSGGELDLQDCAWQAPDESCLTHEHDSVIYCTDAEATLTDGAVRLLAFDGSPSIDGLGRAEVYMSGDWVSICSSGFTAGSEAVLCKSMGFVGAQKSGSTSSCSAFNGQNFCGSSPPLVSEVACVGDETEITACPHEAGSDVYCAASESVVISCAGDGDTQGRLPKVAAPAPLIAPFAPKLSLACESSLSSIGMDTVMPGTSLIGSCPAGCDASSTAVTGSYVFAPESGICKAALHSKVLGSDGGDVVVTVGFGQDAYFGSSGGSIVSKDAGKSRRSFVVSKPVPEMLQTVSVVPTKISAGASTFGNTRL